MVTSGHKLSVSLLQQFFFIVLQIEAPIAIQKGEVGFNSITIPANYRANIGHRNSSIKMPFGKQYIMNSKTRTESSSPIAVYSRHSCRGE